MANKLKNQQQKSKQNYEQIGRVVADLLNTEYFSKKKTIKRNLFIGILRGVGAALGATVVIALLLWFLSLFGEIPFLRPLVHEIKDIIKTQP